MTMGTLYGIGVGPGDPELITLKAIRILKSADVVYAASSTKNDHSLALSIARPYLSQGTPAVMLGFPMTSDANELEDAWLKNAEMVANTLEEGKNSAFLTLGDPLIFSTFGYLMKTLKRLKPDVEIQVIPGVTSYQAAAAKTTTILTESEESLVIASGVCQNDRLKELLEHSDNTVVMKAYRNFDRIRGSLTELGLADRAILVSRCGLSDERIERDINKLEGEKTPYLSLLIVKKG